MEMYFNNRNFLLATNNLDILFDGNFSSWEAFGMKTAEIAKAVQLGYQFSFNSGKMVTIFPISNLSQFYNMCSTALNDYPSEYKVISRDDAIMALEIASQEAEAEAAALEEEHRKQVTDEDVYRAQELLLLTKIANRLGDTSA